MTPDQTNVILAILTFTLAAATVWLAVATWRMASVSKASFDLESRAYFAFKDFMFTFFLEQQEGDEQKSNNALVRIGIKFRNPGRVLIHYQVKTIRVTFDGRTIDEPKFESLGGVIYPNDDTMFWYGTIRNIDVSSFPKSGIVEYTVEYSSFRKKNQSYESSRKIQYTIHSLDPYRIEWLYLSESDS